MNFNTEAIRDRALKNKKNYQKKIRRLKNMPPKKVDDLFHEAHDLAFSKINCLECANCCKTTSPIVLENDVQRMSKNLRMNQGDFYEKYLQIDDDGDYVFKAAPCPFLGVDNYCNVYEFRPKACREYPHTNRKNIKGIANLTLKNSEICPAVQQILDDIASVIN